MAARPTNYNKMLRQNGCFCFFTHSLKVRKVTVERVILERIQFHEIISLGGKRKGTGYYKHLYQQYINFICNEDRYCME